MKDKHTSLISYTHFKSIQKKENNTQFVVQNSISIIKCQFVIHVSALLPTITTFKCGAR